MSIRIVRIILMGIVALSGSLRAQTYDLLLQGGHVIDPKNEINRPMDVALAGGKIARVAPEISSQEAKKTVDVAGLYVTPGLIDIHAHVFAGVGARAQNVYPDDFTFRTGVTTVVDAGSSGWRNFPGFKERVIDRVKTRVLAMLNVAADGMSDSEGEQDPANMDPQAIAKAAKQNPNIIVGVKTAHYRAPDWISVERAVEAGRLANIPVMVDFGSNHPERPLAELLAKKLRPGDIYTHMYSGLRGELTADGRVSPAMYEGRKRGVFFDVGHGGGSWFWPIAAPALREGFLPDSISTDLHAGSMNDGMKELLNVMSKVLQFDVPLHDVIKMATWNPANQIKRPDLGHLSVGAGADVAVIRSASGVFGFPDSRGARLTGDKLLTCELTLRNGEVVWDLNGRAGEDWREVYTETGE